MAMNRNVQQDQLRELTDKLEKGVQEVFQSERYGEYLRVMSKFYRYSYRNTLLIAMQNPNASMVAGYNAWQKNFGRQVKRGEKAIQILSPAPYRKKTEMEVIDQETQQPVLNEDGSIMTEEVEITIPAFRVTSVFDVSQTYGKPLPSLVDNLEGDVTIYEDFMEAMKSVSPVPIAFEPMTDKDGYYHQIEKRIALREGMSQRQTVAAVIHETAHAKLHALDMDHLKESLKERGKDQNTIEVEAESIAYVVSQHYGIETGENSFGYIASWSRNKDLTELHASLKVIRDTACEFINTLDERMIEIRKAREEQVIENYVFSKDDLVLKIEKENKLAYYTVKNIDERDLYHTLSIAGETKLTNVELYLSQNGAVLIPLYSADGSVGDKVVNFYDISYSPNIGYRDIHEMEAREMADMLIARAEYEGTVLDEQQKELIAEYAVFTGTVAETKLLISALERAMESGNKQEMEDVMKSAREEMEGSEFQQIFEDSPVLESKEEARVIYGNEDRFAIYQIKEDSKARDFMFMSKDFVDEHDMIVERPDYEMVYSGLLVGDETYDMIYERFNLDRPEDFKGHSLSVSDVILFQRNGEIQSVYVDSFGFTELPDFMVKEPTFKELMQDREEAAFQVDNLFLEVHVVDEGFDYTFYYPDYTEMDGGIYDNPELTFEQAVREILEGEELRVKNARIIDHDDLEEKVEQAYEKQRALWELPVVEMPMTLISNQTQPDSKLNGLSPAEVEEMVYAIAQAEIVEEDLDATIKAIRVYGSRTREEIYREDSDLDVVMEYEGDIREDDFFNRLNESGIKLAGLPLDINPIRADKTGTIQEFLRRNNAFLDEKEQALKKARETQQLHKVEEQVEQNYNMIDGMINNEPRKEDPVSFKYYAAECDEFHDMGEFYIFDTLQEAVEKYKEILDDPRKSYMGNGLGVCYYNQEDSLLDGSEMALVLGKQIHFENLDLVPFMLEHPEIQRVMEELPGMLPDFSVIHSEKVKEMLYPEDMTADQLAVAIIELAKDFDLYDYWDNEDPNVDLVEEIKYALYTGKQMQYAGLLKDIIEDEGELSEQAEVLLHRLSDFKIKKVPIQEAMVKIIFSEHEDFLKNSMIPLKELDKQVADLDQKLTTGGTGKENTEGTYRLQFTIYYPENNEVKTLDGKLNIGDGDGGILSSIQAQTEFKMEDESWIAFAKSKGEEAYQSYMTELSDMQEHILPHLQSFCSVTERAPEKAVETVEKNNAGNVKTEKTSTVVAPKEEKEKPDKKLSIHERLEINKKKLENQQGKKQQEREGVER